MGLEIYLAAAACMMALPLLAYAAGAADKLSDTPGASYNTLRPSGGANLRDMRLQENAADRVVAPIMNAVAGRMRRLTPMGAIDEMERKINVAGATASWTVERLLATKLAFGCVGLVGAFFFLRSGVTPKNLVLAVLVTAGAYIFPDMKLDRQAKDRANLIERELPDILDQMTIGVEAGLGFDAALSRVANENDGPLAQEFGRMMQDRQLGMSREEAFNRIVHRTDSSDLKHFVLALTQADKHGMPLATVLRVQAEEMRQKRRVRAEEKALALPVKLIVPLVLCILPSLFIVILGPAAFRLSEGGAV